MKAHRSCAGAPVLRRVALALLLAVATGAGLRAQSAPHDAEAFEYRVQPRDTLIGVSRRLLADPEAWPQVARFNGLRNPDLLLPGATLRIPLALMRSQAAPAVVLAASGDVTPADGGAAPRPGSELAEGATLRTGAGGNLVVRLVDGTLLRLRADSELVLRESKRLPDADRVRSAVQLRDGRVELKAPAATGGRPGFRVTTPQGVLAVRGTEFRVAVLVAQQRTLGEVLDGVVTVAGSADGTGQRLQAGFGTQVDGAGRVAAPTPLLPAPAVDRLAALVERPLVVFEWPAIAGAAAYRAQLARDASFDAVVADLTVTVPLVRLARLPDGDYVLRLRASDASGLEGRDSDHRFRLKARPEPPLPRQPAPGERLVGTVAFAWTANPQAQSYRWQLSNDAAFATLLQERRGLTATELSLPGLPPGAYHWRLASERSASDVGPWSDASSFEMRATPPPAPPPSSDVRDDGVSLRWPAAPGQRFDIEIARDAGFGDLVVQQRLDQASFGFVPPAAGRYHLRLRALEADGYVGDWGSAQQFDVPNCLRGLGGTCWRATDGPVLLLP